MKSSLWDFATFVGCLTQFDMFMDVMSQRMVLLDGMGVVCEACSRHVVIHAARMRICLFTVMSQDATMQALKLVI